MKFYFHEQAEFELNQAIDFYENCEPGLGHIQYKKAPEIYASGALYFIQKIWINPYF